MEQLFGANPDTALIVVAILLFVSELLSLIPSVKANGVFQLIYNLIKLIFGKLSAGKGIGGVTPLIQDLPPEKESKPKDPNG